jgi:hypothetical protein
VAEEYPKNASPEWADVESIPFLYVSPVLVNPVGLIEAE